MTQRAPAARRPALVQPPAPPANAALEVDTFGLKSSLIIETQSCMQPCHCFFYATRSSVLSGGGLSPMESMALTIFAILLRVIMKEVRGW